MCYTAPAGLAGRMAAQGRHTSRRTLVVAAGSRPGRWVRKGIEMQPRAVDFVVYGVSSFDRALPFYRDTLGLKLSGEPVYGEDGASWAEFDVAPVTLAIGTPPWADAPQPEARSGAKVALAVPDVNAAAEELKGKGVPVLWGPVETPTCFMAGIADPDGNVLWLHQRKDGTAG